MIEILLVMLSNGDYCCGVEVSSDPPIVVTCAHCIEEGQNVFVFGPDHRGISASALYIDREKDICILQASRSTGLTHVVSDNPDRLPRTFTDRRGVTHDLPEVKESNGVWILPDFRFFAGESGSPVFDSDGTVVGIAKGNVFSSHPTNAYPSQINVETGGIVVPLPSMSFSVAPEQNSGTPQRHPMTRLRILDGMANPAPRVFPLRPFFRNGILERQR